MEVDDVKPGSIHGVLGQTTPDRAPVAATLPDELQVNPVTPSLPPHIHIRYIGSHTGALGVISLCEAWLQVLMGLLNEKFVQESLTCLLLLCPLPTLALEGRLYMSESVTLTFKLFTHILNMQEHLAPKTLLLAASVLPT